MPAADLRTSHAQADFWNPTGFYAGLRDALPDMFTMDEHHHRLEDRHPVVAARG
jgi:hypothetical protein